jgi:hypothetical protein
MDQALQQLYRNYLLDGTLPAYMQYYFGCQRADVEPVCASSLDECPHCVLASINRLYPDPDDRIIHDNILKMFSEYSLTVEGTYLLEKAPIQNDGAPLATICWLPALYYILVPRREPFEKCWSYPPSSGGSGQQYCATYLPQVPARNEIRGHGELCWGEEDPHIAGALRVGAPMEHKKQSTYGFTEWPQTSEVPVLDAIDDEDDSHPTINRWIREIQSIEYSSEAHYVDVEAKAEGKEFIDPDLGPINMHGDKWHMLRITFYDEAGYPTNRYESMFIGQCMENAEGCYGRDETGPVRPVEE